MNTIDNGIEVVIKIEKVITETELYFKVEFIDWYGAVRTKKFMSIEDLEKRTWVE